MSVESTDGSMGGLVIAMDGTSGSGKSSASRQVAARLGMRYLDTGAMYRAMTWQMLLDGIDVTDFDAVPAEPRRPGSRPARSRWRRGSP